jgi:hypothetical protein
MMERRGGEDPRSEAPKQLVLLRLELGIREDAAVAQVAQLAELIGNIGSGGCRRCSHARLDVPPDLLNEGVLAAVEQHRVFIVRGPDQTLAALDGPERSEGDIAVGQVAGLLDKDAPELVKVDVFLTRKQPLGKLRPNALASDADLVGVDLSLPIDALEHQNRGRLYVHLQAPTAAPSPSPPTRTRSCSRYGTARGAVQIVRHDVSGLRGHRAGQRILAFAWLKGTRTRSCRAGS